VENELGTFLEGLRGKMSLRKAADKSGLSHTYIRDLELGVNRVTKTPIKVTPDSLKKLSEAYNFPYAELMKKAGYLEEGANVEDTRDPSDKFIDYIEMELTDDEIIERMDMKVDGMILSEDEIREFIAFVRYNRFKKTQQSANASSNDKR
jgi:transcriptional regulator with XRE-family HTH domain